MIWMLKDDQQRRIAGVVVDIFQPLIDNSTARRAQQLAVIAVRLQDADEQLEMHGQHVRDKDGMGFLHFWGKDCRHSVFTFRAGYSRGHFSQRISGLLRCQGNQNSIW